MLTHPPAKRKDEVEPPNEARSILLSLSLTDMFRSGCTKVL